MLRFKYLLRLLIFINLSTTVLADHETFRNLASKILQEENPHKVTIFTDKTDTNGVICNFITTIPSTVFDVETINSSSTQSFQITNLKISSLHIMLTSNLDEVEKFLDFLIRLSPNSVRPKCLIIFFKSNCSGLTNGDPKKIISYAWSKKYLDFSIIEVFRRNITINDWNPFFETCVQTELSQSIKIFPQKLQNVNGHRIRLPIYHDPPYLDYQTRNNNTLLMGIYLPLFALIIKNMNFTLDYVKLKEDHSFSKIINKSLDLLANDEIELIAVPESLRLVKNHLTVEINEDCRKYVAIAPIIKISTLNVPPKIFVSALVIPTVTICIVWMAQFMKLISGSWSCSKILRILLGIPVVNLVNQVKRSSDRLIIFSILLMSITYTNELYGEILNVNMIREELPLDTFEDLYNSNLQLLSHHVNYLNAFDNQENPEVNKLSLRTREVNTTQECVDQLRSTKKVLCVSTFREAERFLRRFGNLKIAKPVFSCDRVAFVLADGSPFAHRFKVLFQRIIEAKIWRPADFTKNFNNTTEIIEDQLQTTGENFSRQLLVILGVCYSGCMVAFCVERFLNLQSLNKTFEKTVTTAFLFARKKLFAFFKATENLIKLKT